MKFEAVFLIGLALTTVNSAQASSLCGVDCTQEVLDKVACDDGLDGCHTCGARIEYLVDAMEKTEEEACRLIAKDEFPSICGLCKPEVESTPTPTTSTPTPTREPTLSPTTIFPTVVPRLCGVDSCTQNILDGMACDDGLGGCHSCGARIEYLVDAMEKTEEEACRLVAKDEFPSECGFCNPDVESDPMPTTPVPTKKPTLSPTTRFPTKTPTQKPTLTPSQNPSRSPTSFPTNLPSSMYTAKDDFCYAKTCTKDVLDGIACSDSLGGCHSCGSRMDYLVDTLSYIDSEACELVANQFPSVCGLCMPVMVATNPETPINNLCDVATCTNGILDRIACSESIGGCHSCGSRIDYLVNNLEYSNRNACKAVANQFPSVCGLCKPEIVLTQAPPIDPTRLIWYDEFDVDGSPDPSKWGYDHGGDGWGNGELQYYTDRLDNAFVMNGVLQIRAIKENYEGNSYTSARLVTKNKGDWTYGRVQVRARLLKCKATGTWPAIWMLSTDWLYGDWPASGEIDIMEHVGYEDDIVHGTVHTEAFNHMIGTQDTGVIPVSVDGWHTYDIIWGEDEIEFIIDGLKYHEFVRKDSAIYKEWPFDQDFHLILNVAVGGSWGGQQGVDEASFEGDGQIMEVDWVRVYNI